MMTKVYKLMATAVVTSMVATICLVAPLSAQSTPGATQNPAQSQSAAAPASPCLTTGQNAGQNMNPAASSNTSQSGQTTAETAMIGTGTNNAGAPLDCWVALNAHQSHWYQFRYGYNPDRDDTPNPATIKLSMDTPGCISFEVWTPDRLRASQNGVTENDKPVGPVGAGTPEYAAVVHDSTSDKNQNPAKLIWVGSQAGASTFYVVVRNHRDAACTYNLSISGFSVSFPSNTNTTPNG